MSRTKLKPILPSLREKKRYIAFEAIADHAIEFGKVQSDIKDAGKELVGTLGMAKAGMMVLENKWSDNKGIIKVGHKHVDAIKASLALAKSPGVVYRSLGVSGILKKAENNYLKSKSE